jgi:PD-(D/E)XK nuclease superfamily
MPGMPRGDRRAHAGRRGAVLIPLTFDASNHTYALDGRVVRRSVTGVLKHAGLIDFSAIPPDVLERARVRGTTVHQAIHYYNEHDLDLDAFKVDYPEYWPYVEAWITFCDRRDFVPVLCEHRVASRRYHLAGTIDCLGLLDGRAVLLDFATGDPAHAAKDLQTAAYALLAHEWAPEDPPLASFLARHRAIRRYGVRLRADATFALEAYADPADWRHFLALVEAQRIVDARQRTAGAEAVA